MRIKIAAYYVAHGTPYVGWFDKPCPCRLLPLKLKLESKPVFCDIDRLSIATGLSMLGACEF